LYIFMHLKSPVTLCCCCCFLRRCGSFGGGGGGGGQAVATLEGILKKKNSAGIWKDRYAFLETTMFKTFKLKNNKPTQEAKETIDLKDIESVRVLPGEVMQIELKQGTVMMFQGKNVGNWVTTLQARAILVTEQYNQQLQDILTQTVHIEGWLLKKSHNKYQGLQVRFIFLIAPIHVLRPISRRNDT
jgi:hypothetical protein